MELNVLNFSDDWKDNINHLIEKEEHCSLIDDKYCEFFHNLSKEEKLKILKKLKNKYDSDKYKDSEYKKGYIPRTPLYSLLIYYCEKYNLPMENENNNSYFPEIQYNFEDIAQVGIIYGQGVHTYLNIKES